MKAVGLTRYLPIDHPESLMDIELPIPRASFLFFLGAKTFPLENVVEAHQYMESNQQIGKIVITV